MSTPRVGSLSSRTSGSAASQRAMTTFCWLPPRQRRDRGRPGRRELDLQALDVLGQAARVALAREQPAGVSRRSVGSAKFSRIDSDANSALRAARAGRRRCQARGLRAADRASRRVLAHDLAATRRRPRALEERVLAVALQPGQADQLAGAQLELDRPAPGEHEPSPRTTRSPAAPRPSAARRVLRCSAPVISRTSSRGGLAALERRRPSRRSAAR